jgi:hypothetical protein
MNTVSKPVALAAMVVGLAGGSYGVASAASGSGSSQPSTTTTPGPAPNGKFVPNESAAHEAGESAAREAQEDAGQVPTLP